MESESSKIDRDLQIKEWVGESKSLRIFIFGKTGVGKSSLINTLLGIERAEEGADIYSQTKGVKSFTERRIISTVQLTVNDVEVTIFDSPGLRDPYSDEKLTIEEIQKNCKDIDVFIYCTPLTQIRVGQDDFDSISALSNNLGNDIWDKALIALTFANEVRLPLSSQDSHEEHFRKRVSDWSKALRFAITKAGVPKENAESVPVIPTSYRGIPLPGGTKEDWFSDFWNECLQRTKILSLPAVLKLQREKTFIMEQAKVVLTKLFGNKKLVEQLQANIEMLQEEHREQTKRLEKSREKMKITEENYREQMKMLEKQWKQMKITEEERRERMKILEEHRKLLEENREHIKIAVEEGREQMKVVEEYWKHQIKKAEEENREQMKLFIKEQSLLKLMKKEPSQFASTLINTVCDSEPKVV